MKRLSFIAGIALLLTCGCTGQKWINTEELSFEPVGVTISKHKLDGMIVGETRSLKATYTPAEAARHPLIWTSSDEETVSVSEDGVVTATGLGEAMVYVTCSTNEELVDSCLVNVTDASGIKVYDYLLDQEVETNVIYIRNSTAARDYKVFIAVHNSFNTAFDVTSSDIEVASIQAKEVDGKPGFTIVPGTKLGTTTIKVQSAANEEVNFSFDVTLETISVTGLKLSLNEDGSQAGVAIRDEITVSYEKSIRVVFDTDKPGVGTPENTGVGIVSSNTSVATVDARGTYDVATQTVSFKVYMVDNPANAPDGESVITAKSDDGEFTATLTVKAKCPAITSIVLDSAESDPIHAGDTYRITYRLVPEDAYNTSVVWSSADESVATVDATGLVTVKSDFVFDASNASATEIPIRVAAASDSSIYSECTIKPYQYVDATGVMVTDQWGNRWRGTSSTTSKITVGDTSTMNACMSYCSGKGKNKTALFSDAQAWAEASPAVAGVVNVGCMPVYLTATPYPYTYPTIADPEQPFYWACYSNSRFSIAGEESKDGSSATGWTGYSKDDGKSRLFLGHTCKFFTGHSSSTADVLYVRVYKYVDGKANSSTQSKTLLFRASVLTDQGDGKSVQYGGVALKNSDGTGTVFKAVNLNGIPKAFADPCPAKWAGPMPAPGEYWELNDDGSPSGVRKTWGDIPVPSSITEY